MKSIILKHTNAVFLVMALTLLSVSFTPAVWAGTLGFDLDHLFNGTSPAGSPPWLRAVFDDTAAAPGYQVRLTLYGSGLVNNEFVREWFFNLDPSLSPALLGFNPVDISAVDSVAVTTGINAFQANGDGEFDIVFTLPSSGNRFTGGESIVYDMKLNSGTLNAASFNYFSALDGGQGNYLSAGKIQGLAFDESTWVGATTLVPEPLSGGLFVLGGAALACFKRKFRHQNI